MAEYRLTPKAKEDLETVWLYSLKQWGTQQTERYIDGLVEAFVLISENPKTGKACENIRTGYRKYSFIRHAIYYRETSYGVKVIRVLHDRMLATKHL